MGVEAEQGRVHFGVARLDVHLPGVHGLKEKRALLQPIRAALERMGCAVAEVGAQDRWQRAVLGVGVVSSTAGGVDAALAALVEVVERDPRVTVIGMTEVVDDLDA